MIIGIGIDAVDIKRFATWHTKSLSTLKRIFSDTEITYCLSNTNLSAQRFAVRFAAREAAYKALSTMPGVQKFTLLAFTQAITIAKNSFGMPVLLFNWQKLGLTEFPNITWHVSLTHTDTVAIASIIAEQS